MAFRATGGLGREERKASNGSLPRLPSMDCLWPSPLMGERELCLRKSRKCVHALASKYNLEGGWHMAMGYVDDVGTVGCRGREILEISVGLLLAIGSCNE